MPADVLVTLTRGDLPESHHYGAYCVIERGRVVRSRGDIDRRVFYRSAAKPLQAIAVVESGAPERFGFTDEQLALVVGSHDGSAHHAATAAAMLEQIGESAKLLRCGGHQPLSRRVYEEYVRQGFQWGRLEDNCSGKHAGMIGAMKTWGESPATYAEPSSRIQRENLANVALFTGIDEGRIALGTDGCAVPSFAVPLRAMAVAAARFMNPDDLPAEKAAATRRIAAAATSHPEMVAGAHRFDTKLMRAAGGTLLAKMGAEGVQVIGVAGRDLGIAVKIEDGARRALHAVVAELLVEFGLPEMPDFRSPVVRTREGDPVGETRVSL